MPDQTVVLEKNQWQQLIAVLGMAQGPGISWQTVNPLLMAIGAQLQTQDVSALGHGAPTPNAMPGDGFDHDMPSDNPPRRVPRN